MDKDEDKTSQQDVTKDCHNVSEAEIDTALQDSFPASDPPSWTLGTVPCADTTEDTEDLSEKHPNANTTT
jgi:hypothetical protein